MLTKAQTARLGAKSYRGKAQTLTSLEKGLLRWSMAEPGDKVLDLSVKQGRLLSYLQRNMECEICGISEHMEDVRDARAALRNSDIVYASCEDIPWRDESFDAVYLHGENSLSDRAWQEILRVMKPGAQLMIGLSHLHGRWMEREDGETERLSQKRSQLSILLGAKGFDQVTWQRVGLFDGVLIAWKIIPQQN